MCIVYIEWPNLIHLGVSQNYFLVILVSRVDSRGLRSALRFIVDFSHKEIH